MPPKPVEADRLLSIFLRKEFPTKQKRNARAFWKLAMASEKREQGLKTIAFETLKWTLILHTVDTHIAYSGVEQNIAAAVNQQMYANGGIGRELVLGEAADR
jgi:hypothetical protein